MLLYYDIDDANNYGYTFNDSVILCKKLRATVFTQITLFMVLFVYDPLKGRPRWRLTVFYSMSMCVESVHNRV